jgi:hypothetical protein
MEVVTTIIKGSSKNFRAVLKTEDLKQIAVMQQLVWGLILHCANVYTGAQFPKDKMTKEHTDIIDACQSLVFNQFSMFSRDEVKLAFEMAAAGRFDLNMETYYGKFSVQFLGKILHAYKIYRTNVIAKYTESMQLLEARKDDEKKEEKNELARQQVIKEFEEMKETYANDLEIDETKIQAFWGKILVDSGLIVFTQEEKAVIYQEAKEQTVKQLQNELHENGKLLPAEKVGIRNILKEVAQSEKSTDLPNDFKTKAVANYSKLLVKKAIINND